MDNSYQQILIFVGILGTEANQKGKNEKSKRKNGCYVEPASKAGLSGNTPTAGHIGDLVR